MQRIFLRAALVALAMAAAFGARAADTYPSRTIRLVVPFPPGNTADGVARVLGDRLAARLGQPVMIDNRAGAASSIGADAVAKAPGDGYTLLLTSSSTVVLNPSLYRKLPYNVERDFAPVAVIGWLPTLLVANPGVPVSNVPELVDYLQKNPGKVNYGSSGVGTFAHVTMEVFKGATGVELMHVPYRGNAQADTDLLAGNISLMFTSLSTSAPLVDAGKLKAIAVTSPARSPFAPSVPTVAESGISALKDFDVMYWVGLLAPAGTPAPIVKRLNEEVNALLESPGLKEDLGRQKIDLAKPGTPEDMSRLIATEKARWAKVLRDAKIELQDF